METPGAAMLPGGRRFVLMRTKEQNKAVSQQWRNTHPGYAAAKQREWNRTHPKYTFVAGASRRMRSYSVLGGACTICGDSDPTVLQFDHTENDGNIHRGEIGQGSAALISWILKNPIEARSRLQLLCANCHARKKSIFNSIEGYQDTAKKRR